MNIQEVSKTVGSEQTPVKQPTGPQTHPLADIIKEISEHSRHRNDL